MDGTTVRKPTRSFARCESIMCVCAAREKCDSELCVEQQMRQTWKPSSGGGTTAADGQAARILKMRRSVICSRLLRNLLKQPTDCS